ncbi:MAG: LysE family translocator [Candidatus Thermoplasmatota archaeon]|nr:LysE family translocator [Candidatus Thermoplasmatota archaeon]
MNIFLDALIGTALGVSLAAPPGPITSMVIYRALTSIRLAVIIGFGAMTADFVLLVITFFLKTEIDLSNYLKYIYAIGGGFLFLISYLMLRSDNTDKSVTRSGSYLKGLTVGIVNPAQIGWWMTAGLGFLEKFGLPVFYFLFVGTTVWVILLSYAVRVGVKIYGTRLMTAIKAFSFLILIAFGAYFEILAFI